MNAPNAATETKGGLFDAYQGDFIDLAIRAREDLRGRGGDLGSVTAIVVSHCLVENWHRSHARVKVDLRESADELFDLIEEAVGSEPASSHNFLFGVTVVDDTGVEGDAFLDLEPWKGWLARLRLFQPKGRP